MAAAAAPQARASSFRSINQALASAPSTAATTAAAGLTAARQAALGAQNLTNAINRKNTAVSMQQALAKAAAASSQPTAPEGMAMGGLQIGAGVSTKGTVNTSLWNGANLPAQVASSTGTTVTVVQTAALAQLTWQTFNVGPKTHLTFDQSGGGSQANSWIVINRVADPLANPSQILGDISSHGTLTPAGTYAPGGKVYVLNANGIAFGAGSQVNVGSLIAATANIASTQFTTNADGSQNFSLYGAQATSGGKPAGTYLPTFVPFTDAAGNGLTPQAVTVAPGAAITTATPSGSAGGGYVMLLGGSVSNAGFIATPQGQTILAAGAQFTLREGFSGSVSTGNTLSTTIGSEIDASNSNTLASGTILKGLTPGSVTNAAQGIIISDQGDVTLMGQTVVQDGGILSTTTVNTRGTVHLLTDLDVTQPHGKSSTITVDDKDASITLGPNSVTEVMPEDDGTTALTAQRQTDVASSSTLNATRATNPLASGVNPELGDTNFLPDQLGESRIEMSTGGSVDLQPGALAQAQGGQVAVGAGIRVLLQSGSTIDVSGTSTALLPAAINDLVVSVQPYQLRDSAANRAGPLKSTNLNVDASTLLEIAGTGPYSGNIYTPGGLLEVSGYLGLVPHGISEFTAIGGQVTLQAGIVSPNPPSGGQVITEPGSVINVQGGVVNYAAGEVAQSYVMATTGAIYNVNDAPGNLVYSGVYTGDTETHPRWHVTDTFNNPLLTPLEIMEPAYSIGRDAGTVTVIGATTVLQGSIDAGVSLGAIQTGPRPANITDSYLLAQTVVPQAGTLAVDLFLNAASVAFNTNVTIGTASVPGVTISAGGTLPAGLNHTGVLDAGLISDADLANLTVGTAGTITVTAPVSVADGGTISLTGASIKDEASLTARGGGIALSNEGRLASQVLLMPTSRSTIVLGTATTLNASGIWTNAVLQPGTASGEAFAKGGTVTIASADALDLSQGSVIDVASGGALLPGGKSLSATGGSIDIVADDNATAAGTGAVTLESVLLGYGVSGGGTLSIEVPYLRIGTTTAATGTALQRSETVSISSAAITAGFFEAGFSSYVLDGFKALSVAPDPGAPIDVAEPVYVLGGNAGSSGGGNAPTGSDQSQVFSVILPPEYSQSKGSNAVTQRSGASIALLSSVDPANTQGAGGGGGVTIAAGASVSVDPGQSILVSGYGQITVLGTLTAHGGSIAVENTHGVADNSQNGAIPIAFPYVPGLSVWIGAEARLDSSGQAVLLTNGLGQSVTDQSALAGGTITLGSEAAEAAGGLYTVAQVIVRPGAVLDASGSGETVGTVPTAAAPSLAAPNAASTPIALAGAGGTIAVDSAVGVALDGSFMAAAGGAAAAGGVLNLALDAIPSGGYIVPAVLDRPHELLVSNLATLTIGDAALTPGRVSPTASLGIARISQQQIAAGGFGQVALKAEDAILFEGSVTLGGLQSLSLGAGAIGDSQDTASVVLNANVVDFAGYGLGANVTAKRQGSGTLSVNADLIDFSNSVYIGGVSSDYTAPVSNGNTHTNKVLGFTSSVFSSSGDIRFEGNLLQSSGDLTFVAAELLPASHTNATVIAGLNDTLAKSSKANPLAGGTITVLGNGGQQNAVSIGGTLALVADTIVQGGVLHAPEGEVQLGFDLTQDTNFLGEHAGFAYTRAVVLDAGSVTSVSLNGQTIPYGGTVDGVNYLVGSSTTSTPAASALLFTPLLEVESELFAASAGSTIDLSGGGTLAGEGFVPGRGGSVDVLQTSLLNISAAAAVANAKAQVLAVNPVNTGDPVYAILPSYVGRYAPAPFAAQDAGYSAPAAGEQITVGSQIPGLKPGTYTLLPAYYALLPGGFRVELVKGGAVAPGSLASLGNFTSVAPVSLGIAGTGIVANPSGTAAVAEAALFTSAAGVNQLAQYDTESYNTFEQGAGATFGTPRPFLPQDAKTFELNYPNQLGTGTAFSFAPGAVLLKAPDAVDGGYGMTLEINTNNAIDVVASGAVATGQPAGNARSSSPTLVLDASELSALDVPRLIIGGTISVQGSLATVSGNATAVTVGPGAVLSAGDVMLTASAAGGEGVTVSTNAVVSTIGAGSAAFGISQGFYFAVEDGVFNAINIGTPLLDVSGSDVVFLTPGAAQAAFITVADGAKLLASGSLNFVSPAGDSVAIGQALLAGQFVNLNVSTLNLGSATAIAQYDSKYPSQLPTGITLSEATLNTLLNGTTTVVNGSTLTLPGASSLILTANVETNIIGNSILDVADPANNVFALTSNTTSLVLNTPAIYGYGVAGTGTGAGAGAGLTPGDSVVISTPSFTWSGLAAVPQTAGASNNPTATVLPGGQIDGSAGHILPSLVIAAQTITLGYGPQVVPNDQTQVDRTLAGFGNVTLQASGEITANNLSALSAYATQTVLGQPGAGGNLTLTSPLITTAASAVLKLTAGGNLSLTSAPGIAPAATGTVSALGGEIDLAGENIDISTAIGLPSGRLTGTATGLTTVTTAGTVITPGNILLDSGSVIDLSGRNVRMFDQVAPSPGGTLLLESTYGNITEAAGASINVSAPPALVSSPGTSAGGIGLTALQGSVILDGSLTGTGVSGQTAGTFSLIAGTLAASGAGTAAFDHLNTMLATGAFTGERSFEIATGDITIDQPITASTLSVTADSGNITISTVLNASGPSPGSIAINAGGSLTLEAGAVLEAQATSVARDSYGEDIGAANAAHVTLGATTGSLVLDGGATINVGYPDAATNPQGEVVLNAPRLQTAAGVAASTTGSIDVIGALSVVVNAFAAPYVASGTLGDVTQATKQAGAESAVSLQQIAADDNSWAAGLTASAVQQQLGGLTSLTETTITTAVLAGGSISQTQVASAFHLRPGVTIESGASGMLTIQGDLDLSSLRIADPVGFGLQTVAGTEGSGEPGTVVFRAARELVVNGSVSDGFAPPPDTQRHDSIPADGGWVYYSPVNNPQSDPLGADIYLPSTLDVKEVSHGATTITHSVKLGAGTEFNASRQVSLNYDIRIQPADINPNTVIPFSFHAAASGDGATSQNNGVPFGSYQVPAGGFVATAPITSGKISFAAGQFVPGGTILPAGTEFGANSVLPFAVTVKNDTLVPAGTSLSIFSANTTGNNFNITLAANTAILPVNAFIPSNTIAVFLSDNGHPISRLDLRSGSVLGTQLVQGHIYPLAALLPAGSQSWSLDFVAGANLNSADRLAVLPHSELEAETPSPAIPTQVPGTLLLDDQHYTTVGLDGGSGSSQATNANAAFSVIRTGTGDLNLVAGGNFNQSSLYGIYTAGTQEYLPSASGTATATDANNAPFDLGLQPQGTNGALLPTSRLNATLDQLILATYQAYYPNGGGNLSLTVQGNATGDELGLAPGNQPTGENSDAPPSDAVGSWLFRQADPAFGQPSAWWINYGTFLVPPGSQTANASTQGEATLVGFQGIGTLGGGNLTVTIGGNAGQTTDRTGLNPNGYNTPTRGEGLILVVAGTGRFPTGGSPMLTGGGDLTVHIGGTLNPLDANFYDSNGSQQAVNGEVVDLRGSVSLTGGAVGQVDTANAPVNYDPRTVSPFSITDGTPYDGITLVPGDGTIQITTLRDLVVGSVEDAGLQTQLNHVDVAASSIPGGYVFDGETSGFTLWRPNTTISLFSSGGNVTPAGQAQNYQTFLNLTYDQEVSDGRFVYPPVLLVAAASGSIIYGINQVVGLQSTDLATPSIETMPAPLGNVEFLAGTSIIANGEAVDISGANPALLATPQDPNYTANVVLLSNPNKAPTIIASSFSYPGLLSTSTSPSVGGLFAQEPDTPTFDLHANDTTPARFYAANGDIVDFITGETFTFTAASGQVLPQWYIAAKPAWIIASEDIVSSGTRPTNAPFSTQQNQQPIQSGGILLATSSGDLFYNTSPSSVSVVSAGRDILSGYFYVGGASQYGAGVLEVDAGRNLNDTSSGTYTDSLLDQQLNFGAIKSIGPLIEGAPIQPGANLAVLSGVGADPNYSAFADIYLNPANLQNPALQITDQANKDKVQQVYAGTDTVAGQSQLVTVLQQRSGFSGTPAQALAIYQSLSPTQQAALLSPAGSSTAVLSPLYAYLLNSAPGLLTNGAWNGTEGTALAAFQTLPSFDQTVFVREVFFDETNAGGLQYNDPTSRFYHSYARGQVAIDTFFLPLPELNDWLSKNYGYTGGQTGAANDFATLTPMQQKPFITAIFTDDETPRSASEPTVTSPVTGQTAAEDPVFTALLGVPDNKGQGIPDGYTGSTTMASGDLGIGGPIGGGGIATQFDAGISSSTYGGTIQAFDPGGSIILGVAGSPAPGPNTGIITDGPGDINVFADGSVLLGKSRIFTTDGGSILIWSADGDINAGVGAKTTVVYNAPILTYDASGDVTETPAVPSSGAGIATLQPLAGIPAGNVDLVAPAGTIDAGEAGIRVSGNLNLAAARLANTANIAVGGKTSGITVAPSISVGAAAAASSAAGASAVATQNSAASHAQEQQPSIIEVAVLSIAGGNTDDEKRRRKVQ